MSESHGLYQLHQIAIHFEDLSVSRDFYRDILGARFIAEFSPPGLVFFDFNGVRLLLEKGATKGTIYFRVDDIATEVARLEDKGIEFDQQPHVIFKDDDGLFGPKGYEESMAFFKDPGGNILALSSQHPAAN